uniref:Sestrin-1 n=1 Tax=Macrostomum lignano TaxID=282301 RepID=A0A1I8G793_9PLAT
MAESYTEPSTLPIDRTVDSISMLRSLSSREPNVRQDTVSQCQTTFRVWYHGLGSPPTQTESQYLDSLSLAGGDPSFRRNIEEQLPELLRLAKAAPLADTREKASELLDFVQTSRRKRSPQKPTESACTACTMCLSSSLGANVGRKRSSASNKEWSRADTEYYRMLADRYRDSLRRSRDSEQFGKPLANGAKAASADAVDNAAVPPSLQDSLNMRVPRPRIDRASNFIKQCDLVPLDPTMQPQQLPRRRHYNTLNGDGDEDAGAAGESTAGNLVALSAHELDQEQVERSQALLLEQFHEWHRCCNMFHVMAYHPDYLAIFLQFHNTLLQGNGPIGVAERHYLAIMAAARHRCSYLVHLHAIEFLHLSGDPEWLRGLAHASPKMRKLGPLCRLLAHRPWDVTPAVLRSLLSGPDSYSQSEFVHALCLLSHFIALSGFVAGTGVRPELDFPHGHTYQFDSGADRFGLHASAGGSMNGSCGVPASPAPSSPGADPKQRVLDLMEAMKSIDGTVESGLPEDQLLERFETMEEETAGIRFHKAASKEQLSDSSVEQVCAELANFCDDPSFEYKDFHQVKQDTKCHSFRIQDYSWEEDGSCLIDRFLPAFGTELNRRFQACSSLTYGTMGPNQDVETTPFRRAIWYYILSIFGLRHDDYDYQLINKLLNIDLKKYCKLVACCPDQASLLYGLRALNSHMTEQQ